MKLRVFGSGSQGNALAVSSGGTLLLLDCGFLCTELERRMAACGVEPDAAAGLFFSHDHSDHCKGLAVFHKRHPSVPLYANGNTADSIAVLTGVDDGEGALVVGTDMGAPTFGVRDALASATCAVLESNHDPVLLQTSDRPVSVKQRIAGRCGHLSNGDAADLVREVRPTRLKTLLLAHLSRHCNAPYLALESMRAAVSELGHPVTLDVLSQDAPSPLYEF